MKKFLFLLLGCLSVSSFQAQSIQSNAEKTERFICYFNYNSANWSKDSIAKFNAWLKPFLQKNGLKMSLTAYTDTIGSVERNQALAQRRLNAVQGYMAKQNFGIDQTFALGESYEKNNYRNDKLYRKVEIVIQFQDDANGANLNEIEAAMQDLMQERMQVFANSTEAIVLNIQFVPGQDVYIGDSYLDVAALLQYLKQNPNKKAFIRGHVCCANDMDLSTRRALAVYNDLLYEGIAAERISYEGFGNTMPATEELDEFTRQQNRRVDVVFSDL